MRGIFNSRSLRDQFPVFSHQPQLCYLDNASTTQKPRVVIERLIRFYEQENANAHRGVYDLASEATILYENARKFVATRLNASSQEEILFVKGATEAINLVAESWANSELKAGDEILLTAMEHHSNILPWQRVASRKGVKIQICQLTPTGQLDREDFSKKLTGKTRLVAVTHLSNVLGTINPVKELATEAHRLGAKILVDGAQWIAHAPVDVQDLACDFYLFSGHKIFAPMGIGVLYGKRELLQKMEPYQLGGGMVDRVLERQSTFRPLPEKFDAGTPLIAGAVALKTALRFLDRIDWEAYHTQEQEILDFLGDEFRRLPGVRYLGDNKNKAPIFSLHCDQVHSHDLASFLGSRKIAVRAGHHCAQWLLSAFDVGQTVRASFSLYNDLEDAKRLLENIRAGLHLFS